MGVMEEGNMRLEVVVALLGLFLLPTGTLAAPKDPSDLFGFWPGMTLAELRQVASSSTEYDIVVEEKAGIDARLLIYLHVFPKGQYTKEKMEGIIARALNLATPCKYPGYGKRASDASVIEAEYSQLSTGCETSTTSVGVQTCGSLPNRIEQISLVYYAGRHLGCDSSLAVCKAIVAKYKKEIRVHDDAWERLVYLWTTARTDVTRLLYLYSEGCSYDLMLDNLLPDGHRELLGKSKREPSTPVVPDKNL